LPIVQVLLATDASWLVGDVVAALGGPDTSFTVCSEGREVSKVVTERSLRDERFDVGIFDLQIGSMGGMAVTMSLRLDESAGRLPRVPVLMLLDRRADLHLARRCAADGWLIKPLDPLRLRRASDALLAGMRYTEGIESDDGVMLDPMINLGAPSQAVVDTEIVAEATTPEGDPVNAG
jgi:DNA-binding NarL/FixJ family response regulator